MKISVDKVEDVDYAKAMREFGLEDITPYLKKMKDLPILFRRGAVFGHRDFGVIFDAMNKKKKFSVLTGVNPSASLHFGNKMFLDQAMFFQKHGADLFIPISNDETYVFKKSQTLEETIENAYNTVIPDILGFGFKAKNTHIFISTRDSRVYELAVKLSRFITLSTLKAIFGFKNETNPGQIFYAITQASHILFPQLDDFGGPRPIVVPIGIGQDPYIKLTRDIAPRAGFIKPSSTYHLFMRAIDGSSKMSASDKKSAIFLTDKPEVAKKKIFNAKTGGRGSAEEQKRLGANPDDCVVFEYYKYHLLEKDKDLEKVETECRTGKRLCGECKAECACLLEKFLKKYQKQREKMKDKVEKFIVK